VVIARCIHWSSFGFELSVEELVERLERVEWIEDLVDGEIVECDEARDVERRGRRIVFDALLDREGFEQLSS
jgi:hypothetical protein